MRGLRALAALVVAAAAAAAVLERRSPLCAVRREGSLEAASLSSGESEFLLLRASSSSAVHAVRLAAPAGPVPLSVRTPRMSAEALRAGLDGALRDPLFWPRLPARLARLRAWGSEGSLYDALLAAWILQRAGPHGVVFWSAKAPVDPARALGLARERASGAPEPAAPETVEVLNASGQDGLAWKATKTLRWRGIDVAHLGNADSVERATRFVDRVGRPKSARRTAESLCPGAPLEVELEEGSRASLTLVLGEDHARCRGLEPEVPL